MAKVYHVGIDFGTSQTKICSYQFPQQQNKSFIFHRFSVNEKYMLPTTIRLTENKCIYGEDAQGLIRYFKMKALNGENVYALNSLLDNIIDCKKITQEILSQYPEICTILYLTYCILDVKGILETVYNEKEVKQKNFKPENKSFLSRMFSKTNKQFSAEDNQEKIEFLFTIGIPTEYDKTQYNLPERSKQYEMLFMAKRMAEIYVKKDAFCKSDIHELVNTLYIIFEEIKTNNLGKVPDSFYQETHGLFAIAETTAGIAPLKYNMDRSIGLQNTLGNYMTMDVGAGTTDISFFEIFLERDLHMIKYFASKSIDLASNSLILNYLNSANLEDVIKFDINSIDIEQWNQAQHIVRSHIFNNIRQHILPILLDFFRSNFRDNWNYDNGISKAKGCKVYGGGSRFSEFSQGELLLNHGGVNHYAPNLQTSTTLSVWNRQEMTSALNFIQYDGIPVKVEEKIKITDSIDFLITALGLVLCDPLNRPDRWVTPARIQNTRNDDDGMARYDIFNRDWI